MNNIWVWVAGAIVCLCIVALLAFARSDRQAYWSHKTEPVLHTLMTPQPAHRFPPSFLR